MTQHANSMKLCINWAFKKYTLKKENKNAAPLTTKNQICQNFVLCTLHANGDAKASILHQF